MIETLDTLIRGRRASLYAGLKPGVSEAMLDAFEREFGHTLPPLFRELYKWRNGQDPADFTDFQPSQGVMFMSLEDIRSTVADLRELQECGDLEAGIWSVSWFPFMDNGGGNHLCLDLSPGGHATVVYHDHEVPAGDIIARNLQEWLEMIINEYRELSGA